MTYEGVWQPPPPRYEPPRRTRRTGVLIVVLVVIGLLVIAALINGLRSLSGPSGGKAAAPIPSSATPSPSSSPSGTSGPSGRPPGGGLGIPAVACPQIRDEQSHLTYRCIDNYLTQANPDPFLGLRISLVHLVEPDWVISEGSGNPRSLASQPPNTVAWNSTASGTRGYPAAASSTSQVAAEVHRRVALAMQQAYGTNPTSRTMSDRSRDFAGVTGYEVSTEVTINPAFRAQQHLQVKKERLWTVGLPTPAGVSIFMLSIPDGRADLWPKAEATVRTLRVI